MKMMTDKNVFRGMIHTDEKLFSIIMSLELTYCRQKALIQGGRSVAVWSPNSYTMISPKRRRPPAVTVQRVKNSQL